MGAAARRNRSPARPKAGREDASLIQSRSPQLWKWLIPPSAGAGRPRRCEMAGGGGRGGFGAARRSLAQPSPPPSVAAAAAEGGMRRGGGTGVCRHASSRVPGRGPPRESDRRFSPRSSRSGVAAEVTGAGGAASLPAGTGLAWGHAPLQSQGLPQRRYHQRSSLWPCAGALPALPSWECRPIHRWQAVNDHGFRL